MHASDPCFWPADARTREALRANLARHRRRVLETGGLRAAAVAVTLVAGRAGDTAVLLTRRTARLSTHSGQYALPGGRVDPGEGAVEAALRELEEELGLALAPGDLVGVLDDLPTRSGYLVTPFVFWAGGKVRLRPSRDEIAAVHHVPLGDLFAGPGRGGNRAQEAADRGEAGVFSLFIPTLGHDLFAPTAAILDHFREVALIGRAHRIVTFGEPAFARR